MYVCIGRMRWRVGSARCFLAEKAQTVPHGALPGHYSRARLKPAEEPGAQLLLLAPHPPATAAAISLRASRCRPARRASRGPGGGGVDLNSHVWDMARPASSPCRLRMCVRICSIIKLNNDN